MAIILLVVGIVVSIFAVVFALQNAIPVTVTLFAIEFQSSLALVLLSAFAIGALVALLLTSPLTLKNLWILRKLRKRIYLLEEELGLEHDESGKKLEKSEKIERVKEGKTTPPAPIPEIVEPVPAAPTPVKREPTVDPVLLEENPKSEKRL